MLNLLKQWEKAEKEIKTLGDRESELWKIQSVLEAKIQKAMRNHKPNFFKNAPKNLSMIFGKYRVTISRYYWKSPVITIKKGK